MSNQLSSDTFGGKRSAGLLIPVFSLPGPFFIGDIGLPAQQFADFLYNTFQSCWQLLPINPTDSGTGHSPYSSYSSMAGNFMLISPELLVRDRLVDASFLERHKGESTNAVDYKQAFEFKTLLLDKAYSNWSRRVSDNEEDTSAFEDYCNRENDWLTDFALFSVFRDIYKKPWFEWPDPYKNRDPQLLAEALVEHAEAIRKIKWVQMIFDSQWKQLKAYCEERHISIMGDIPFYLSHDSADVWASREIFSIDQKGAVKAMAGVPPDYFNEDGQLWGMPLYDWAQLRQQNYKWWIDRLKRNIDWFHLVRLDHFRAFSSYWEIDAKSASAREGRWMQGPASHFFSAVKEHFDSFPFIAEDLGEIHKDVYILRDEFNLPGMNVFHFAFGNDMPKSNYLPHFHKSNAVVYTGTHDNNTTVGWFRDIPAWQRKNLSEYLGVKVTEKNVCDKLSRLAYASVCNLVILPVQDVLELPETARMNTPASVANNWQWRMKDGALGKKIERRLKKWAFYYDRIVAAIPHSRAAIAKKRAKMGGTGIGEK